MKVVIIGGGAGGASAAARLRRLNQEASITILEKTEEISIGTCGMPYYIGGDIEDGDELRVATPEYFKKLLNVDVELKAEVISINRKNKSVETKNGKTFLYDKLILATGAAPIMPSIEGIRLDHVFALRHLFDAEAIKKFIATHKVKTAAVIGGGFIGIEMAENLHNLGIKVTLIEKAKHIMMNMDIDTVCLAQNKMRDKGIKLILGDGLKKITAKMVRLESEAEIKAEMVIMAIGIRPETALAKDAGVELGINNAVKVDAHMQTSDKDIYACGDSVEVKDLVDGSPAIIALAGPANRQGRIIADNICGGYETYKDSLGTAVVKIFDLTLARVGNSEMQLIHKKIDYKKVHIWADHHAGYYPGAQEMLLKLLFNDKGKILGAQIAGYEGVDKRIDVIATLMRAKGTIQDMIDAELAYAPPYSSAKDPVNLAGMAANNILKGYVKAVHGTEFGEALIVDVRPAEAYKKSHMSGAINIPMAKVADEIGKLPKDKKIVLACFRGKTSYMAARNLAMDKAHEIYSLSGGFKLYEALMKDKQA